MKPFLLRLVIAILIILGFAALSFFSPPSGIPILNYHQINDVDENMLTVSTTEFETQLAWLEGNGYQTITVSELLDFLEGKGSLPERPVLITFDDGYIDNYQCAFPILKKHNMKACIFLISEYVSLYPNYLTWEQLAEMQLSGIEFGSHTVDHNVLTELSPNSVNHELVDSKNLLEKRLGRRIDVLAYPCGYTNEYIKSRVNAFGYRAAFTVNLGNVHPGDDLYALNRVPIFGALPHTMFRFESRMRCPRLAAWLENLQKDLIRSGHTGLAELLPSL
ncbi:MAG: polysaccharide deacetylase family protein [Schwartzia sp.]|nr:polysaccharide deacetylase family protein [Schwartzia sp. (in: firmicutes)]